MFFRFRESSGLYFWNHDFSVCKLNHPCGFFYTLLRDFSCFNGCPVVLKIRENDTDQERHYPGFQRFLALGDIAPPQYKGPSESIVCFWPISILTVLYFIFIAMEKRPTRIKNILHLWEFLMELLEDDRNGSVITWTSKDHGEFKLINPDEVARRWGETKKRSGMTYDTLSRALRFYYQKDIIRKVNKTCCVLIPTWSACAVSGGTSVSSEEK